MISLLPPLDSAAAILGPQRPEASGTRPSRFCFRVPCDDGTLLYHTLTQELLLLEPGDREEELRDTLYAGRFLVPETQDETRLAAQLRQIAGFLQPQKPGITSYLLFPTTDCNARCAYCFELTRRRLNMSDRIAHDAAAYIRGHCAGQKVKLRWFGGEPLFHTRALELITADLRQMDVRFESQMTSNGFLFDEALVQTAKNDWKLRQIQITLDGTEAVYNRTKAYVHSEGSAYQRVLRNIGLLLDAEIRVVLRLNIGLSNWEDMLALADELSARFPDRALLTVYPALLRDYGPKKNSADQRRELMERFTRVYRRLEENGLRRKPVLPRTIRLNECMADSDNSLSILPDGTLGKCEHESENGSVGSIYSDALNAEALASWRERLEIDACRTCVLYPQCTHLKRCGSFPEGCDEFVRAERLFDLRERVKNSYQLEKSRRNGSGPAFRPAEDVELC